MLDKKIQNKLIENLTYIVSECEEYGFTHLKVAYRAGENCLYFISKLNSDADIDEHVLVGLNYDFTKLLDCSVETLSEDMLDEHYQAELMSSSVEMKSRKENEIRQLLESVPQLHQQKPQQSDIVIATEVIKTIQNHNPGFGPDPGKKGLNLT